MSFSGGNKFGNFDKFRWKQIYYPFFLKSEWGLSRAGNLDNWIKVLDLFVLIFVCLYLQFIILVFVMQVLLKILYRYTVNLGRQ